MSTRIIVTDSVVSGSCRLLLEPVPDSPAPGAPGGRGDDAPSEPSLLIGPGSGGADIMEQYRKAFDELFGSGLQARERLWRMGQEAAKEASLTEDFPLSQDPNKADQWQE